MMMMKKFDKEKLQRGEFINYGAFGAVYQGDYEGQKVAIKVLEFGNNRGEEATFKKKEASVWSKLNHPNVAKFIGATQMKFPENSGKKDQEKLYLCMVSEFLEGDTLASYLWERRKKRLRFKTVIRLALDIARGLSYLHSEEVVHRDVKLTNMVLDGQGRVKLINFGLAPEVRRCGPYSDVFSFGMCLWEIFYCVEMKRTNVQPRIHSDCPPKLAELMSQCWCSEGRPEMSEVVKALEEMSAEEEAKARKKMFKGCFGFL